MIYVSQVPIRIKLNPMSYGDIIKKLNRGVKKKFVEERHAIQWIEENTVGDITKEKLEEQRFSELNALDMM